MKTKRLIRSFITLLCGASLAYADNPSGGGPCPPEEKDCYGGCSGDEYLGSVPIDEECPTGSFYFSYSLGVASIGKHEDLQSMSRVGLAEGTFAAKNKTRNFDDLKVLYFGGDELHIDNVYLSMSSVDLTTEFLDPKSLLFNRDRTVEFVEDEKVIQQVVTDNLFTNVTKDADGFTVQSWSLEGVELVKINGAYELPTVDPVKTVNVKNPDHPAFNRRIEISYSEFFTGSVRERTSLYEQSADSDTIIHSTYAGIGVARSIVKRETLNYSDRGTRKWDYTVLRTSEKADQNNGSYGTLQLVGKILETYRDFSSPSSSGDSNGKRLMKKVVGFDSDDPRETVYDYYDDPNNKFLHGRLKSQVNSDGYWEYWEYVDSEGASTSVETKYISFKDLPIAQYQNGVKQETIIEDKIATRTTALSGTPISKTVFEISENENGEQVFREKRWNGSDYHILTKVFNIAGNNLSSFRPKYQLNPDGTATHYSYTQDAQGNLVTTKTVGAGDENGVTAGMVERTTYNTFYNEIAYELSDVETGLVLNTWFGENFDRIGRPQRIFYNNNPDDYEEKLYDCCGLSYQRLRNGTIIETSRDLLKRIYRREIRTSAFDPIPVVTTTNFTGLTTSTSRSADGTTLFVSERTKALNGDLLTQKLPDADGDGQPEITTYSYTDLPTGARQRTITSPDGSTQITTPYLDGQIKLLSGSRVADTAYDYFSHNLNNGGMATKATRLTTTGGTSEFTVSYRDQLYRPFQTVYADGTAATMSYFDTTAPAGSIGKLVSMSDAEGVTTTYTYNAEGERNSTTRELSNNQQLVTLTDQEVVDDTVSGIGVALRSTETTNGVLTNTSYRSGDGYRSKTVSLSGTSTSLRTIPVEGAWTATTTLPNGSYSIQTVSNGLLQKTEAFDNIGAKLTQNTYTYDAFDRTLTTTDGRGLITTISGYLENGATTAIIDSAGHSTSYTYDMMGRVTLTDSPDTLNKDGTTLTNRNYSAYYPTGQIKAEWGAQTYPKAYQYDEQNRLLTLHTYQVDPNFGTDPALISSKNYTLPASAAQTKWTYDAQRGFMTQKQYDDGNGTTYTYSAAGRLLTRTWARGVSTTYTYDKGQLATVDYSDSTPDLTHTYDNFGRISTVAKAGLPHASYTYDAATLQLTSETLNQDTSNPATLTRSYDPLLRPSSVALGSQHQYGYTYDAAGRLRTVTSSALHGSVPNNEIHTYDYLANAPQLLESVTSPAHTVTNLYEANRNVLDTKTNKTLGGVTLSQYDYLVNAIGQREQVDRTGSAFASPPSSANALSWKYDALGQVATADYDDNALDQSYAYDQIGNRLSKTQNSATASYTSNALNQLTSKTENASPAAYTYDADGNLLSDGTATYTWDGEHRLLTSTKDGVTTSYQYDYLSRRISKETSGVVTRYHYDGWNPVAEYTGTSLSKTYLWGTDLSGSLQGAGGVGGLLSVRENDETCYPAYDGNGNVSEYVDEDAATVAHYEYDAFGNEIESKITGAKANDFAHRFSTKPFDRETGFYYYGYRYYNPVTGKWLSRDPIEEEGGYNLYRAMNNNALNSIDPHGKVVQCAAVLLHPGTWVVIGVTVVVVTNPDSTQTITTTIVEAAEELWQIFEQVGEFCCDKGEKVIEKTREAVSKLTRHVCKYSHQKVVGAGYMCVYTCTNGAIRLRTPQSNGSCKPDVIII